jgi:hypothetical protein
VDDELEEGFRTGAVAALRRRAARRRKLAADWTVTGANGIRIAERIAEALEQTANELEREGAQ